MNVKYTRPRGGGNLLLLTKPSNAQVVYQCKPCPAGTYSDASTGWKCKSANCENGYYLDENTRKCTRCLNGIYCIDNEGIKCPGYVSQDIFYKSRKYRNLIDNIIKYLGNKDNSCESIRKDEKKLIKKYYDMLMDYIQKYNILESCAPELAKFVKEKLLYEQNVKDIFRSNLIKNYADLSVACSKDSSISAQKIKEGMTKILLNQISEIYNDYIEKKRGYCGAYNSTFGLDALHKGLDPIIKECLNIEKKRKNIEICISVNDFTSNIDIKIYKCRKTQQPAPFTKCNNHNPFSKIDNLENIKNVCFPSNYSKE